MFRSELTLPFSEACEKNRRPILSVLKRYLSGKPHHVLEIGSGTGQHAVYFARCMPHIRWTPSDLPQAREAMETRLMQAGLKNLMPLQILDVMQPNWPGSFDAVFTANTLHIMSWEQVEKALSGIASRLPNGGLCFIYGPFNYEGRYTSESNKMFDQLLQTNDPRSGIRDFEEVRDVFSRGSMVLEEDVEMPANNRMLVWKKS